MFAARSAARAVCKVGAFQARAFSEVPINDVARVIRFKVTGEETAQDADIELKRTFKALKKHAGIIKVTRQLCKTEWGAYYCVLQNLHAPHVCTSSERWLIGWR